MSVDRLAFYTDLKQVSSVNKPTTKQKRYEIEIKNRIWDPIHELYYLETLQKVDAQNTY